MEQPITVIVQTGLHQGKQEGLNAILEPLLQSVDTETGTLDYRGFSDGARTIFLETYRDSEALVAHLKNPAVQKALEALPTVLDIKEITVLGTVSPAAKEALAPLQAVVLGPAGGVSQLFPQAVTV